MRAIRYGAMLLVLSGCMIGSSAEKYQPARGPAGATVKIQLVDKSRMEGELLAVEEASLLIRQGDELLRVPVASIRRGEAPQVSFRGSNLTGKQREDLQLISRYPKGVSAQLEQSLLQAYGQTSVRAVP